MGVCSRIQTSKRDSRGELEASARVRPMQVRPRPPAPPGSAQHLAVRAPASVCASLVFALELRRFGRRRTNVLCGRRRPGGSVLSCLSPRFGARVNASAGQDAVLHSCLMPNTEVWKFDTQFDVSICFDTQFTTFSKFDTLHTNSFKFFQRDSKSFIISFPSHPILSCDRTKLPLALSI
jgi:hypothetical protein